LLSLAFALAGCLLSTFAALFRKEFPIDFCQHQKKVIARSALSLAPA
jgi:hypothetical protein